MNRERKEVYSPPKIKTVSFVVEMGLGMSMGLSVSTVCFEPMTWDDGTPSSRSSLFERDDWNNQGGNSTTSFEMERW